MERLRFKTFEVWKTSEVRPKKTSEVGFILSKLGDFGSRLPIPFYNPVIGIETGVD